MMKRQKKSRVKLDTFPKVIITLVVGHGLLMTTLSYVLAFMEKDPVAEVSTVLITEVVAPIVVYLATNLIANIFEKNYLSFSIPKDSKWMQNKTKASKYKEQTDYE